MRRKAATAGGGDRAGERPARLTPIRGTVHALEFSDEDLRQLLAGVVPEAIRAQCRVSLMSTLEWIAFLRRDRSEP